jgi:hypothetical protein
MFESSGADLRQGCGIATRCEGDLVGAAGLARGATTVASAQQNGPPILLCGTVVKDAVAF